MAALVLGVAGAALLGPVGLGLTTAGTGWLIGSTIGSLLGGGKDTNTQGPRLNDLSVQASTYGTMVPVVYGAYKVNGNVIFATDLREVSTTTRVGGKGGPKATQTTYSYNCDIAIALCDNQITAIRKIFTSGKLTFDASVGGNVETAFASSVRAASFKLYLGTETQLPDPTIEATLGVGSTPAYRGVAYVVFSQLDCPNGQIPQLSFEILSAVTAQTDVLAIGSVSPAQDGFARYPVVIKADTAYHIDSVGISEPTFTIKIKKVGVGYVEVLPPILVGNITGSTVHGINSASTYSEVLYTSNVAGSKVIFVALDLETGKRKTIYDGPELTLKTWSNGATLSSHDPISGAYVIAKYKESLAGAVVIFSGSGAVFEVVGFFTLLHGVGAYNGIIYVLSIPDSGTTYGPCKITTYSEKTGAQISTFSGPSGVVGAGQSGSYQYIYAGPEGTFVHLDTAVGRAVYKVSGTQFTLLGTVIGMGGGSSITPGGFHSSDERTVAGPNAIVNSTATYKVGAFNRVADSGIALSQVIQNICIRAGLPASNLDTTAVTGNVAGYALTNVSSARANIDPLLKSFFIDPLKTDGKIKFRPRAGLPSAATIVFDELGAIQDSGTTGEPFAMQRTQEDDLPRSYAISFINPAADYQVGTETARRIITNSINDQTIQLAVVMDSNRAATIANALMYNDWAERNKRSLEVTRKFAALDAGDVITVEYPRGRFAPYRITRANDTGVTCKFDVVDYEGAVYTVQALGSPASKQSGQIGVTLTSPSRIQMLDIPILRDADDNAGIYAAVTALTSSWSGAVIFSGPDDLNLEPQATANVSSVVGAADTVLANWTQGIFDEINTVEVTVGVGDLFNATREEVLGSQANAALLGGEILQFTTATLITGKKYRLSGLLRGQRGTEAARGTHVTGERFVTLKPDALRRIMFDLADLGAARRFSAVTIGQLIEKASKISATNTGQGLKPFAPVNMRSSRNTTGQITVTWDRRTRYAENWLAGIFPLGETSEAYDVEILKGAVLLATRRVTSASYIHTTDDQQRDFGSSAQSSATVTYRVSQVSAQGGRGASLSGTFTYPIAKKVTTITLSGTASAGITIGVYEGGSPLGGSHITTGTDTIASIATSLASKISTVTNFSATAVGGVITVIGPTGSQLPFVDIIRSSNLIYMLFSSTAEATPVTFGSQSQYALFISNTVTGVTSPVPAGTVLSLSFYSGALNVGTPVTVSYTVPATVEKELAFSDLASAVQQNTRVAGMGWRVAPGGIFAASGEALGPFGVNAELIGGGSYPWVVSSSKLKFGAPAFPNGSAQSIDVTLSGVTPFNGDVFAIILAGTTFSTTATATSTKRTVADALVTAINGTTYSAAVTVDTATTCTIAITAKTVNAPFTYSTKVTTSITATVV